jgi:cytochrome P450
MAAPEVRVSARTMRRDFQGRLEEAARTGGLAWLAAGGTRFLIVSEPGLVREVMVTRAGELQKPVSQTIDLTGEPVRIADPAVVAPLRRALARGMTTERTADVRAAVEAAVSAETSDWKDGFRFRLMPRVRRLAIRIAAQGAFASRVSEDEVVELERVMRWFNRSPRVVTPGSHRLHRFTPHGLARKRTLAGLHAVAGAVLANADPNKTSEATALAELPAEQRVPTATELLLGAVGPLAQTTGWMLWRFATEPDEAALLREEWNAEGERRTEAFVREVTRLHPTNVRITRIAVADTTVGGEPVPRDSRVILNVLAMQREPADFDPSRWLEGRPDPYVSFGAGGRRCLGESIAMTALSALLPALFRDRDLSFDALRATSRGRHQLGDEVTASVALRRAPPEAPPGDPRRS